MSVAPLPPLHDEPPEEPRRPAGWKKALRWIAAGIGILIILAVVAAVVVLRTDAFHRYILRVAQEKVSAALGTQVQARSFDLHWSGLSPTVDLYDVVVYGAPPYATPPLLQVDHIGVGVRVVSVLQRTWYLNHVAINHPVLRVFVDARGRDNLPQTKSSGQSHTSVFDVGVRHLLLDRGEVYYNSRKSVLNADLHELTFQSTFDPPQKHYSGNIGYRNGHIQLGTYNPMPHNLEARFDATPAAFNLHHAVLTSGPSQFVLDATLDNYSQPRVQASYSALLDTGESRRITKDATLPLGVIRMAGSLHYQSEPKRPMLDTVTLAGTLDSRGLQVQSGTLRTQISDIAARYSVAHGNLDVPDLRARLLGGTLTGSLTMRDIAGDSRSHLRARLSGISLAQVANLMSAPATATGAGGENALQQVSLNGVLNADADAAWGKTFSNLVAVTDATIRANAGPSTGSTTTTGKPNAVPLNGVLHARYTAANSQLTLTQSFLRMPQTSLTLNGTVSNRSRLQVQLQSNNLHELETVADMFRKPAALGQPVEPLGLYGTASFMGAVQGSTRVPRLTGHLQAANLRVKGTQWRSVRTDVGLSPSEARLQNAQLDAVPRGRISFNLSTGLKDWSFTKTSPFQVALNATQLNVQDLTRAAGSQAPVTGVLSANVSAQGSQLSPAGHGTIALTNATVEEEPIQSATLNFQGTGEDVHGTLTIHMPAGTPRAVFDYYPKQEGYRAQLTATGIRLDQLKTLKARNLQVAGVLNLTAGGEGTLANPQLTADLNAPQLKVANQTINGLTFQATVANHVANYSLNSEVVNTSVRSRGTVHLTDGYYAEATFDTQTIPLQPLLAMYAPSQAGSITGQTEIHGTLRGPLKNKSLLEAHVTIPVLQANYNNAVQIGAANPIHIDFTNGVLALQRATLRGTDTDLQIQGNVPINSQAPASVLLLGNVDLRLIQLVNPDLTSSGQVRFNINSFGTRANPNVQGQVQVMNANFASGDLPIGLQNGNGVLTLTRDRLEITRFEGTVGGGTVTASGGLAYRPALGFDVALAGRGIRMLYPEGVREGVDLNLALTGTPKAAQLVGRVQIDQLSFTPDFDLTTFANQFSGETAPAPTTGFSQNLQLNVAVQSSSGLNLSSRTLSLAGTANLRVTGAAAQPVILGRVNLSGGDLIFNGNRYVLQGGTIDFVNPSQTQPNVNLAVQTTVQQYNISLQFQGPMDHLHTNYSSDPALPPADIISLLAFGKTSEASAANPAPGNLGAQSLVASQVSSQVTSRLEKVAGISHLSVDPLLSCNQQGQGSCVTVHQRVTSQIFVTFQTDVTSVQNETIELQYQPSPRLTLSGTRDQNGGFGFDARIHKTW